MVRTSYHGQCTCTEALVQTQIQIAISRPGHRDAWRPVFTDSRLFLNRLRRDIHRDSIFELSVNTTSGAPSFVRSLRKGWETTDIHRNCKHPGRKRSKALRARLLPALAPSGRFTPLQQAISSAPDPPALFAPASLESPDPPHPAPHREV